MTLNVIPPKFTAEQMGIPNDRPAGIVYLPADFYSFRISLKRLWMKHRILRLMILMNPLGFRPHILKEKPSYTTMEVSETAIGECGVPEEKREEYAIETATKIVLRQYKTFLWEPAVEISETFPLYIPAYIDRGEVETYLYDTFTGKKVLVDNPLFNRT